MKTKGFFALISLACVLLLLAACAPKSAKTGYSLSEQMYERGLISVKYPVISGLSDKEFEAQCNERIYKCAVGETAYYNDKDTYTVRYEVTEQTEDTLSLLMLGDVSAQGAAHPSSFVRTVNIDLARGAFLRLPDLVDIASVAEDIVSGNGITIVSGTAESEISEYLKSRSAEELAAELADFDLADGDLPAVGYSYTKHGKIHICLSVPHALGDYVDLELS